MSGKLWCVHVLGPDDLIAKASKSEALEEANSINIRISNQTRYEIDPIVIALVEEWPYCAETHAKELVRTTHTPPLNTQDGVDERARQLEHLLDESGKLADWINEARPVVLDLMAALERRVRTDCTPEQIEQRPWRCSEYVAAEQLLARKPVAVVEVARSNLSKNTLTRSDT